MLRQYDKPIVDIVDYVYHYEVGEGVVWKYARMALLDAMGCAIETICKSDECRSMLGPTVPGTTTPDGFRLPGTAFQVDPLKGAFDMGTLIRYLDHNDALGGAEWGHPSGKTLHPPTWVLYNIGAILPVADWLSRASASGRLLYTGPPLTIRSLLTAIIKAYEIQGCYQMRNAFNTYGLDHVVLVKLASTAVSGWLLGLSEEQTQAAISHVWMDGQPTRVYRTGVETIPRKGWAAGDACMRAVHLLFLIRAGQPGAPGALSSPRYGFYARTFGNKGFDLPKPFSTWAIQNIFFKIMPVEGHGISSVEAALIQRQRLLERGVGAECISSINVRTTAAANLIISKQGPLHNAADRDHCIQYVIALAFLKGAFPETQDYNDDSSWATSTELAALRAKVAVRADEQLTKDYLDIEKKSVGSAMTVCLEDGTTLDEVIVECPAGHVQSSGTRAILEEKFARNMRLMFSKPEVAKIRDAVEQDDMSIMGFVDLFARNTPLGAKL